MLKEVLTAERRERSCGDLNPEIDKKGGNLQPKTDVVKAIEDLKSDLDVYDIWRIKHPTTWSYTWHQPTNYIFVG